MPEKIIWLSGGDDEAGVGGDEEGADEDERGRVLRGCARGLDVISTETFCWKSFRRAGGRRENIAMRRAWMRERRGRQGEVHDFHDWDARTRDIENYLITAMLHRTRRGFYGK
jgi:hypothetical protein